LAIARDAQPAFWLRLDYLSQILQLAGQLGVIISQ
jgi:hypothetical protein